jgi:hypothetical protein
LSLRPVVAGGGLAEDEVARMEDNEARVASAFNLKGSQIAKK